MRASHREASSVHRSWPRANQCERVPSPASSPLATRRHAKLAPIARRFAQEGDTIAGDLSSPPYDTALAPGGGPVRLSAAPP
jgi:hypothetical protein